jgi:hypothetical protein
MHEKPISTEDALKRILLTIPPKQITLVFIHRKMFGCVFPGRLRRALLIVKDLSILVITEPLAHNHADYVFVDVILCEGLLFRSTTMAMR